MLPKHDRIDGILEPYSPYVSLWAKNGSVYRQGDQVPTVGLATTYSVCLHSSILGSPARYLWVQDLFVTNTMAHGCIQKASVFDAWGRYLGQGGSALMAAGQGPTLPSKSKALETVSSESLQDTPLEEAKEPLKTTGVVQHRFHLRRDLEISFDLPTDLNDEEAARLARFVRTLPFGETRK